MKQKPVHAAMEKYLSGEVILMDKPLRWTSFDAVKKVRVVTGVSKVGHAGTLDPLATGLLIICTGAFTKKITEYMGMEKEYRGTITFGALTETYDLESVPYNLKDASNITDENIYAAAKKFIGEITQVPPAHSAIKKDGKRLYMLAREGKEVIPEPRRIMINEFEITNITLPNIDFKVVCSTGTYIRSLANDVGNELGVGGYLSSLRRTRIGNFLVDDALSPQQFEKEILMKKNMIV